jgi:cell division protein ZapA (FtsZ GTPase activity inhibitor)
LSKRAVAVRISGQEYRIRSDADEASLQRVAACVDAAMEQVRARTGTVDTLDVALLTSLNLAREVLALREKVESADGMDPAMAFADTERLGALIEFVESALASDGAGDPGREADPDAEVLTLPQPSDSKGADESLLGSMLDAVEGVEAVGDSGAGAPTGHREAREASS